MSVGERFIASDSKRLTSAETAAMQAGKQASRDLSKTTSTWDGSSSAPTSFSRSQLLTRQSICYNREESLEPSNRTVCAQVPQSIGVRIFAL